MTYLIQKLDKNITGVFGSIRSHLVSSSSLEDCLNRLGSMGLRTCSQLAEKSGTYQVLREFSDGFLGVQPKSSRKVNPSRSRMYETAYYFVAHNGSATITRTEDIFTGVYHA